jgi:uncharacterized protein (TIGR03435 family)
MIFRMAAAALIVIVGVYGQTTAPASGPKFEVASFKLSQPGGRGGGIRPAPGGERYLATNVTLRLLLTVAYRIKPEQIVGGPGWIDTERYDMNAKAERPSSIEELHAMLVDLLTERYNLKFHKDTKELPMYALSVDKNGPSAKLQAHAAQSAGDPWIDQAINGAVQVKMHAKFVPMDYFAWRISQMVDRPVVDQTSLKGGYDFDLAFTRELPPGIPENANINGSPIDTSGPTLFEALRQQLGLKLERQKGPVEILVIDHVEKAVVEN